MPKKQLVQRAFTSTSNQGLLRVLTTSVRVFEKPVVNPLEGKDYVAIWDTGATNSCITKNVVDHLNLKPISKTRVSGAFGEEIKNVYMVSIGLPNKVGFPNMPVTEVVLKDADVLIGMDIISDGDFAVTNKGGLTKFSYRHPSMEHIDFVKQINSQKAVHNVKVGRNVPCPCGSGKKYKKCHGK